MRHLVPAARAALPLVSFLLLAAPAALPAQMRSAPGELRLTTPGGPSASRPAAATDGLQKLLFKGADAGKSKAIVKAKGPNLPLGIPAALQTSAQATIQLRASDGECLSATLGDVIKQTSDSFKAK